MQQTARGAFRRLACPCNHATLGSVLGSPGWGSLHTFLLRRTVDRGNSTGRSIALRTYELVLVVQPGLDEEGLDAFVNTFTGMVDEAGGQVVDMEHMGRRRLAYPIRKATEGHYVLLHLNLESPALREIERRIRLSEDVLRHLIVRMDELMEPVPASSEAPSEGVAEQAEEQVEGVDDDALAAELADELAEDAPES